MRGETELGKLADEWGLTVVGGRMATGYVAEEAEPWDGSDDPEGFEIPRELGMLLDQFACRVPGTHVVRRSKPQGGLVRVELELEADGETPLPDGWELEAGGVGHFGRGGWAFHWMGGVAMVNSGETGMQEANEPAADREAAARVFSRFGSHW